MATRHFIAVRTANAIESLDQGLAIIARETGVEFPEMLKRSKYSPQALQAVQLETFAETIWLIVAALGWAPPKAEAVETPPTTGDALDLMTDEELFALAQEWNIELNVVATRDDTLQAIRGSDRWLAGPPETGDALDTMSRDDLIALAQEWNIAFEEDDEDTVIIQAIRDSGLLITQPEPPNPENGDPAVPPEAGETAYDEMTVAALRELAESRGINVADARRKAEFISLLLRDDIEHRGG